MTISRGCPSRPPPGAASGRSTGMGGTIVVERLEPGASGSLIGLVAVTFASYSQPEERAVLNPDAQGALV